VYKRQAQNLSVAVATFKVDGGAASSAMRSLSAAPARKTLPAKVAVKGLPKPSVRNSADEWEDF